MDKHASSLTPFLVVDNAAKALEFYTSAFAASELEKYTAPDGRVTAKISISNTPLWIGDEEPAFDNVGPKKLGGSPVRMVLVVADPDTVYARALNAGATQICPVTTEESWKIGKLSDPFGHVWEIGHPLV